MEPKWWMTSAALTPAAWAMARSPDAEAVLTHLLDRGVADPRDGRQIVR